jgi:hypothetical protein
VADASIRETRRAARTKRLEARGVEAVQTVEGTRPEEAVGVEGERDHGRMGQTVAHAVDLESLPAVLAL